MYTRSVYEVDAAFHKMADAKTYAIIADMQTKGTGKWKESADNMNDWHFMRNDESLVVVYMDPQARGRNDFELNDELMTPLLEGSAK